MVEVADWIADRYHALQQWSRERFADDPRKAEIAKYSTLAVCVAGVALVVIALLWLTLTVLGAILQGVFHALTTGGTWALERGPNGS
ncbi:hypothetical protein [Nonomuraea ceibae]|uniref:hypothetical protein n=1 Tax=Nonomuraea ceibae TaxID=1935170 RepID=UPI001C5F66E9|nr:hypothetical protein [Nonomuraea ceibae]